jgi:hypothetical protein
MSDNPSACQGYAKVVSKCLFECSICLDFFKRPCAVVPCGHMYCEPCILAQMESDCAAHHDATCPECRGPLDNYVRSFMTEKIMDEMKSGGPDTKFPALAPEAEDTPVKPKPVLTETEVDAVGSEYHKLAAALLARGTKRSAPTTCSTWPSARTGLGSVPVALDETGTVLWTFLFWLD